MKEISIKRNDLGRIFIGRCRNDDGTYVDLTNCTAKFIMRNEFGVAKINAAAERVAPYTDGRVKYQPIAGDTDTSGEYIGEFEIVPPLGQPFTVPSDGYIVIHILEDLG